MGCDRHVQRGLETQILFDAKPSEQRRRLGAAAHENVLSCIKVAECGVRKRTGASSESGTLLDESHGVSMFCERAGASDAGGTAADYDDRVGRHRVPIHVFGTRRSFVLVPIGVMEREDRPTAWEILRKYSS